jgi:hypothetical protein
VTKQSTTSTTTLVEPKDKSRYVRAIQEGQNILKTDGSKAHAARAIFRLLNDETREIVLKAFIEGAGVTPKGSPTYYYNISRKFRKQKFK